MNSTLRKLARIKRLSTHDWRLLSRALVLLPTSAFLLKIRGYKRTRIVLSGLSRRKLKVRCPDKSQLELARRVADMVSLAARHGPYRANCLKKSLVTELLLAQEGIPAKLRIGVNRREGRLDAHAWVEVDEEVLIGGRDAKALYQVFL